MKYQANCNKNNLVSIVMRTYNRKDRLLKATKSVLEQTYSNLQLIIINDDSTDESEVFIKDLMKYDARITYYKRPRNSRISPREEPMNDGLKLVKGNYIAHLDDDNLWRAEFVEKLANILDANSEIQLAYADTCEHYDADDPILIYADPKPHYRPTENQIVYPHRSSFTRLEFDQNNSCYLDYIDTNEMMYRASALKAIGGSWSLGHPKRDLINKIQGNAYEYRLHNDVEIAERIVNHFGESALHYHPEVLVDYFEKSSSNSTYSSLIASPSLV